MNNLEIRDVYDVYYDGREPFPHLPQLREDHADERETRVGAPRQARDQGAPRAQSPAAGN